MPHGAITQIAVAVVVDGDRFLIGKRPEHVPLAGYWEFPGGKIHPGETALEAAARECFEETGIEIQPLSSFQTVTHEYAHGVLQLQFVMCRTMTRTPPRDPFRWVERARLAAYRFPEANRQIIAALLSHEEDDQSRR